MWERQTLPEPSDIVDNVLVLVLIQLNRLLQLQASLVLQQVRALCSVREGHHLWVVLESPHALSHLIPLHPVHQLLIFSCFQELREDGAF